MTIEKRKRRKVVGEVVVYNDRTSFYTLKLNEDFKDSIKLHSNRVTENWLSSRDAIKIEDGLVFGREEEEDYCSGCENQPLYKGKEPYCPVCE